MTLTTNITFGMYLTPLGNGFVVTPQTLLSALNGDAGVRVNGTSAPDLDIGLSDGTVYPVSLQGLQTVQQVVDAFQAATNGKVQLTIDPASQYSLDVTQSPSTAIALKFTQAATNLTLSTPLASLNSGVGIRTVGSGADDLQITLTDGTSFDVSLGQAVTVGDLINAIQNASGGSVKVSINATVVDCSSARRRRSARMDRVCLDLGS